MASVSEETSLTTNNAPIYACNARQQILVGLEYERHLDRVFLWRLILVELVQYKSMQSLKMAYA